MQKKIYAISVNFLIGILAAVLCGKVDANTAQASGVSQEQFVPAKLVTPVEIGNPVGVARVGWLLLAVNIDESGSPTSTEILVSTGNTQLEEIAQKKFMSAKWVPATLNGNNTTDQRQFRLNLSSSRQADSNPDSSNTSAYRRLIKAIGKDDKADADKLLSLITSFKTKNSGDFVLSSLASWNYNRKWGSMLDQYDALNDAIAAREESYTAFPKNAYPNVLVEMFRVQVGLGHVMDAYNTAELIASNKNVDKETKARVEKIVEQVKSQLGAGSRNVISIRLNKFGRAFTELGTGVFAVFDGAEHLGSVVLACRNGRYRLTPVAGETIAIPGAPNACYTTFYGSPGTTLRIIEAY